MVNVDKIKSLAKEQGITLTYLCEAVSQQPYYFNDVKKRNGDIPDDRLKIIAQILDVTPEYLRDEPIKSDKMLSRILSLIPKKPNGEFVHGAKKEFAQSIGYSGGEIVSDWISGRSDSYKNKIYEISAKYGVPVEWLTGEIDSKGKKSANGFNYEKFETLRARKGITKKFIADQLGRLPTICQDWKYGKSSPNPEQLKIIASVLDTTVEYLTDETDEIKKPADNVDEPIDQTDQTIMNLLKLFPADERQAIIAELAARLAEKK